MKQWYSNLKEYFPAKEMKSEDHMLRLMEEKKDIYKVETGPDYTLVYYDHPEFFFIDYILVNSTLRGSGVGSRLMEQIKKNDKPIILEVDPITPEDPLTAKRVRFYEKLHFTKVQAIQYVRNHPITGKKNEIDIFYWSPRKVSDAWLLDQMKKIYEDVHTFLSQEFYDTVPKSASDVLQLLEQSAPSSKAK